jgi:hypothetical protein
VTDLSKPPGPDEIMRYLAGAIRERRFESVPHLLSLLTRTAPAKAEAMYGAMLAALLEGPEAAVERRPEVIPGAQMSLFGKPAA